MTSCHNSIESFRFSVVVPVHNGANYLLEALESVASQTLPHWECIIVDDGSRDRSFDIAAEWASKYPDCTKVLQHKNRERKGVAKSRNLGISRATAPWIAFLDQDDLWQPHKLERQAAFLDDHKDVAALGCLFRIQYDSGPEIAFLENWSAIIHSLDARNSGRMQLEDFIAGCPFCLSGVVASRSCLIELGGFDPTLLRTSDWLMWACMASRHPLALMRENLVTYRIHGKNAMLALHHRPVDFIRSFMEFHDRLAAWLAADRNLTRSQAKSQVATMLRVNGQHWLEQLKEQQTHAK